MMFDDNDIFAAELKDKELNLIQGGAPFTPEEQEQVKGILNKASEHHGVNLLSTIGQVSISTVIGFGAYDAGKLAGKKARDSKK